MIELKGLGALPKLSIEQLNSMELLPNYVLFKPHRRSDELITKHGWITNPDAASKQGMNMCVKGTIVKAGKRTLWEEHGALGEHRWTYSKEEIKANDVVWAGNEAIIQAYQMGFVQGTENIFHIEGSNDHVLMLHFCHLTAVQTDFLEMLNGWVLVRPLKKKTETSFWMPEHKKETTNNIVAEVVKVNKSPVTYFSEHYPNDKDVQIKEKDVVVIARNADVPFESKQDLSFGEMFYRVQRRNIYAVIENYNNNVQQIEIQYTKEY